MTSTPPRASQPLARAMMDRALLADNGVRIYLNDADHSNDPQAAWKEASRWQQACKGARRDQREAQAKAAMAEGLSGPALAAAKLTAYDRVTTAIHRDDANRRWVLTLTAIKSSLDEFDLEEF